MHNNQLSLWIATLGEMSEDETEEDEEEDNNDDGDDDDAAKLA